VTVTKRRGDVVVAVDGTARGANSQLNVRVMLPRSAPVELRELLERIADAVLSELAPP
jgi:acetolactate synthase regulatory subunit